MTAAAVTVAAAAELMVVVATKMAVMMAAMMARIVVAAAKVTATVVSICTDNLRTKVRSWRSSLTSAGAPPHRIHITLAALPSMAHIGPRKWR